VPTILNGFHAGFDVIMCAPAGQGKTTACVLAALTAVLSRTKVCQVIVVVPSREAATDVAGLASRISHLLKTNCVAAVPPFQSVRRSERQPQLIVGTCADVTALYRSRPDLSTVLRMFVVDDADQVLSAASGGSDELFGLVSATFGLSNFPQIVLSAAELTGAIRAAIPRLLRTDIVTVSFT
jgi:superfamily II DNA/RNA helicase